MAIHFAASVGAVACGRTGASLDSTEDKTQVSCKLCLRSLDKETVEPVRKTPSLAELRAAAKAAKAAAEAPIVKPAAPFTNTSATGLLSGSARCLFKWICIAADTTTAIDVRE